MGFNVKTCLFQPGQWVALVMTIALIGGSYGWIQGVAWVGMTARGIQKYQSITLALGKTFDGSAPCALCDAIDKNQSDSESPQDLLTLQKQKEVPYELLQSLIVPKLPEIGTLRESFFKPAVLGQLPETPPPEYLFS